MTERHLFLAKQLFIILLAAAMLALSHKARGASFSCSAAESSSEPTISGSTELLGLNSEQDVRPARSDKTSKDTGATSFSSTPRTNPTASKRIDPTVLVILLAGIFGAAAHYLPRRDDRFQSGFRNLTWLPIIFSWGLTGLGLIILFYALR